ncbi:glutathione S-transferase 1-like [Aricia agestis]|uniref:glutathione S-transferase 1-like n=1 Tax=Aricia agestis TaxID=91739 RepID=UPI001C208746|nr:glutathione S-transferase 1-like [Aricia agestis]
MVLTLYTFELSPCARAVHMVIHKLGLADVQYVEINVLKKEQFDENYLKINPQHTIPTLVDDELIIIDSHAIVTYLVNKYAPGDELYPADPQPRAMVDQRLHFDSGSLFTGLRMAVGDLLSGNKCIRAEIISRITSSYEFTEMFLTSDWIAGDHLTLADICCVATISSLNAVFPIDNDLYPNLKAWILRCSELDFYKACNEPGLALFKEAMFA